MTDNFATVTAGTTMDANLRPFNSPMLEKRPELGFDFDTNSDRGMVNTIHIRNAAIKTAKIDDLAVTTAKVGSAAITTAKIDDLAVTNAKIQNFNFSKGTGGTLTLGGTANGNGVLHINNAVGTTIITGDNLGHHYYGTSGTQELVRVDAEGFHAYTGGTEQFTMNDSGLFMYGTIQDVLKFRSSTASTASYGRIGYSTAQSAFFIASGNNQGIYIFPIDANQDTIMGATRDAFTYGQRDAFTAGDRHAIVSSGNSGSVFIDASDNSLGDVMITTGASGDLYVNGVQHKLAIVPTSKGYNSLYCTESPEVWFMDFCASKDDIDPLFLEVTSPPYHFIKCEDGEYQVWGKRKGSEKERFEPKTKEQFERNNAFWAQPHQIDKRKNDHTIKVDAFLKEKREFLKGIR